MPARILVAVFFAAAPAFAADGVPQLDMKPGCRAAADSAASIKRDFDSCLKSEEGARDKLKAAWKEFPAEDRTRCTGMTKTGGPPSYVELLTCVEMARDARQIRQTAPPPLERPARSSR